MSMCDRFFYFIVFLCFTVFIGGCGNSKTQTDSIRLVIISTNDMHAQLQNFPRLATLVDRMKAENPHVLLVDGGDRFSGSVYVDNAEERGKPMILLMNRLGYDLATYGNHEFDYGQEELRKRIDEAEFPVIAANIKSEHTALGRIAPYAKISEGGIDFYFLGLLQRSEKTKIPATNPANVEGITFPDYREIAPLYTHLKDSGDVFVGLTHLGFYDDSLLAVQMPELDFIIGGHSHTLIEQPKYINEVMVTQTGSGLRYAGIITLDFRGKELIHKTFRVVKLDTIPENPEIVALVDSLCNRPEFLEEVGLTSKGLKHKEDVASLVTDAMCRAANADFAFYNKGGIRLNSMKPGAITREMVYRIEPFHNYIMTHELTLQEVKSLILNRFNGTRDPQKRYIDLFVSQGKYTIIQDEKGNGTDVVFVDKAGRKLKDNSRKYKVALSNYVNSSYDFAGKGKGINSGIPIVEAVFAYLKKEKDVNYNQQRAFVVKK